MPPEATATHNQLEFTVSELSQAIKRAVEGGFGYVRVRGEISGYKLASSGHAYMTLKDADACLDAVCWKGTIGKLAFKPEDGIEIICAGRVTTYPGRSKYQLVIEHMEPAGAGALMALLEKRKAALAAEGLFDASRKQLLPYLPEVIGVVTSPTGAVIRDILHRIADRFPRHVLVWPVLVQGQGAAEQIAAAIEGFNALPERSREVGKSGSREVGKSGSREVERSGSPELKNQAPPLFSTSRLPDFPTSLFRPDLLIVARGGGSLEDLWAFNEEIVVRAAAASLIPIISAVGHETDTTLIDFAADQRAPTPTAAAEMAVPVRAELQLTVQEYQQRLGRGVLKRLEDRNERVRGLSRGLPNPAQLLGHAAQRLDDRAERLQAALPALLEKRRGRLMELTGKLNPSILQQNVMRHAEDVKKSAAQLSRALLRYLQDHEKHVLQTARLLGSMDYHKVLERGFALVRDPAGHVVKSAAAVAAGKEYTVTFIDGDVKVKKA